MFSFVGVWRWESKIQVLGWGGVKKFTGREEGPFNSSRVVFLMLE